MIRLLTALFFLFHFGSQAQVPDYFADNPEWQQSRLCQDPQGSTQTWDWVYYIDGDTLINGHVWQKVRSRGITTITDFGGFASYPYDVYQKAIRQDSLKVFAVENGNEELLYDFNLSVGDTLPVSYYHPSTTTVIDSIEMVTINGTQRKKMYISDSSTPIVGTFILEGMGSDIGLFEPIVQTLNCGSYFHCYRVNFVTEVGSNCNFSVDLEEQNLDVQIDLYPNPINDQLHFSIPDKLMLTSIQISNSEGKLLRIENYGELTGEGILQTSDLIPGIYLVQFQFENGQNHQARVIKM